MTIIFYLPTKYQPFVEKKYDLENQISVYSYIH